MDGKSFTAYADEVGYLMTGDDVKLMLWNEGLAEIKKQVLSGRSPTAKPTLNLETLTNILELQGITVRFNKISRELEIRGADPKYDPEQVTEQLPIILHDQLRDLYVCSKESIADLLGVISGINSYNPVVELISSVQWDKQDRIREVFDILCLDPQDNLSKTLIIKWLCQTVALPQNFSERPFGADGMLVLQGPQGIGKTSFVRILSMRSDLCKLGQYIDPRDKDTMRRCCTAWIVELGELESTMRGDLERLKCFVTAEADQYRLPYARTDCKQPRRSSLVGTCNTMRFLNDSTGNRRFWTVPVTKIDLNRLNKLNVPQLWAEVKSIVDEKGLQCFRLTHEEQTELAKRNCDHEMPLKAQDEVEDILDDAAKNPTAYIWTKATVSEFKDDYPSLQKYTVEQIGKALAKLGIEQNGAKKVDGISKRCRNVPLKKNLHPYRQ